MFARLVSANSLAVCLWCDALTGVEMSGFADSICLGAGSCLVTHFLVSGGAFLVWCLPTDRPSYQHEAGLWKNTCMYVTPLVDSLTAYIHLRLEKFITTFFRTLYFI